MQATFPQSCNLNPFNSQASWRRLTSGVAISSSATGVKNQAAQLLDASVTIGWWAWCCERSEEGSRWWQGRTGRVEETKTPTIMGWKQDVRDGLHVSLPTAFRTWWNTDEANYLQLSSSLTHLNILNTHTHTLMLITVGLWPALGWKTKP